MFMNILKYRCEQYDRKLVQIGRFEASTPICSVCEERHSGLTLADRSWQCSHCGTLHDRDINAAKNILRLGRALSSRLGDVSLIPVLQESAITV